MRIYIRPISCLLQTKTAGLNDLAAGQLAEPQLGRPGQLAEPQLGGPGQLTEPQLGGLLVF